MTQNKGIDLTNGQGFIAWLMIEKGLSQSWARDIYWYVNRLLIRENIPFPDKEDADKLALQILQSDYSKSHKRNMLKAIEHYMEFIGKPVKFKKPLKGKRLPRYLTQDEMRKLIRSARNYREFGILTIFCTTGLRLNEVRMLNINDLSFSRKVITVRCAKLDKDREVPMSEDCERVLKAYLEKYFTMERRRANAPLFESIRGNRISPHALSSTVKNCAQRAEIKQTVSPHVLRHSFATAMIGNGCDLFHLSDILGHSNIETTTIYLHVNNEARRLAFNKGVPKF